MCLLLLSSSYTKSWLGFSVPHSVPPVRRLGMYKERGGDTAGTLSPTDQRDILYHITLCTAIILGERWLGACGSGPSWSSAGWWWAVVLNSISCRSWVLFISLCYFPFNYIVVYLFIYLFLLTVLIPAPEISHFYPSSSHLLPSTGAGKWASGRMMFSCQLWLNHDTSQLK